MKTLYSILITCSYIILLSGCDIVEPPYTVSSTGEPVNPGPGALRKVLLEDFTGHQCGNCPSAAYLAQELKDLYGDQLIIYAAHVGSYAFPDITPYLYDFRCVTGNEIADQFGVVAAFFHGGPARVAIEFDHVTEFPHPHRVGAQFI